LSDGELVANEIGYVNAHGTGTTANVEDPSRAIGKTAPQARLEKRNAG